MSTLHHTAWSGAVSAAALLVASAMAGNELAVALVNRQLARLADTTRASAARALAAFFGRVMPFWYALTLALTLAALGTAPPRGTAAWGLTAAAAALFAASIGVTLTALVPINNRIAAWDVARLPAGWRDDDARWNARHRVRVAVLFVATALLAAGIVAGA